jgi:hypothetical protein
MKITSAPRPSMHRHVVFDSAPLFWIQIGEVRRVHRPTPHDSETRGILVSFATLMGRNCPNLFSMPYTSN